LRRIELAKPNPGYLAGNHHGIPQQQQQQQQQQTAAPPAAYQMPVNTGFFSAPVAGMEY
jgi:hypothetical protein